MSTARTIFIALLLAASLLLTSGGAAAKGHDPNRGSGKPQKAHLTWSMPRIEQSLSPGHTVEISVTLTSSTDLANLTLQPSGGLREVLTVEPATIASLKAGVTTPVKLTITMPAAGAHSQGGVIQVLAGQRHLPSKLKVKLTVPGASDDAEGNDGDND